MCMHFAICNFHLADKFEKISMTEEDRFSKVNGEQLLLEPSTGTGGKPQAGPGAAPGARQSVGGSRAARCGPEPSERLTRRFFGPQLPETAFYRWEKDERRPRELSPRTERDARADCSPRTGRLHTRTCTGPSRGAGRCLGALRASGTIENLKTLICWVFWLHVKGNKI